MDVIGKPPGYGKRNRYEYNKHDYHCPSDEIKADWELTGAAEDTRLLFQVGYAVAQGDTWPQWKPGSEFKSRREKMLGKK